MCIPQLDFCCCGCSLRTGTKIIGWLSLIGSIILLILDALGIMALHKAEQDGNIPKDLKDAIPIFRVLLIFGAILFLFKAFISILLLLGTYQNKPQYLLWWIWTYVFGLIYNVVDGIANFSIGFKAGVLVQHLIPLALSIYFLLVVYSFYKEIRNGSGNYVRIE